MKKKIYAAYHTHLQGNMTAFDRGVRSSRRANMANVDFGHWIAAGSVGGTPMQFLEKHHGRISSFHLKDRTTPEHCALNLPWGTGETPIKDILQLVKARTVDDTGLGGAGVSDSAGIGRRRRSAGSASSTCRAALRG